MKSNCKKWEEDLLEAALNTAPSAALAGHLLTCRECTIELNSLRMRQQQMNDLLPSLAQAAEPEQLGARILNKVYTAAESPRLGRPWKIWVAVPALAALCFALGLIVERSTAPRATSAEVIAAERMAEWRAPTDALLQTSGQEFLRSTPNIGETYFKLSERCCR